MKSLRFVIIIKSSFESHRLTVPRFTTFSTHKKHLICHTYSQYNNHATHRTTFSSASNSPTLFSMWDCGGRVTSNFTIFMMMLWNKREKVFFLLACFVCIHLSVFSFHCQPWLFWTLREFYLFSRFSFPVRCFHSYWANFHRRLMQQVVK